MIMGDIELSPQLGVDCHNDVQKHCSDLPKNQEGAVINCLMALAPLVFYFLSPSYFTRCVTSRHEVRV